MRAFSDDRGATLIEAMIAVLIAMIGVFSLGSIVFQSAATSKNQGTEVTRSTIYAQDKMEKLLSLNFAACNQTASSQPAACNTTSITASGWTQGLLAGGVLTPLQINCPSSGATVGYVDYLDANGIQLSGTSCSPISSAVPSYIRQWGVADITADSAGPPRVVGLKRITVAVYSQNAVNVSSAGGKPVVILTSVMSNSN